MSNEENSNNLNVKYNRLISDYKSLREKHNLLKNALIGEREKSKELESLLVENGIQSRKVLQEIESLKFRNDMLSKQINTLRDELDHEKQSKSSKKGAFKSKETNPTNEEIIVIKEELTKKIEEYSSLHSQLSSLKLEYQMDTNNFRSAINDLENQLKLVKTQNIADDLKIRKALANEIEERSTLEIKLENKDNIINKLEITEKALSQEIEELKSRLLLSRPISPCSSTTFRKELPPCLDSIQLKEKELKISDSLDGSLASLPNNEHLNTNEIYICSLIDKIGLLEQTVIGLEMENQVGAKRHQIEKKFRDLFADFIVSRGDELPKLESSKSGPSTGKTDRFYLSDSDQCVVQFYQSKFATLHQQLYQAVAKAALFFDEAKALNNRLEIEHTENIALREEIETLKDKIVSVQDDLDLTGRQYENKMKEMSIHISELSAQIENKRPVVVKGFGDNFVPGNENISSIKGFINSLKK